MLIHVPCTTCDVIIFYSRRQVCQFHVTRAGWGDLSNHTRMTSTIQSMRPEKKAKKHVTLGQKFPWESCCSTRLPFLSFNFNILKAFPRNFSHRIKDYEMSSRRKQMTQEKAEEEERRKSGKILKLTLPSWHACPNLTEANILHLMWRLRSVQPLHSLFGI